MVTTSIDSAEGSHAMTSTVHRATRGDADQIAIIIGEIILENNPVGFDRDVPKDEVAAWIDRQGDNGTVLVDDDGRHDLGFAAIDFDSARPEECSFGAWIRERNRRQTAPNWPARHSHSRESVALNKSAHDYRTRTSPHSPTGPRSARWCRCAARALASSYRSTKSPRTSHDRC